MAQLSDPTLNKLIEEVRALLNQPKASNSYWTDTELKTYLNDAVRTYFQEVVERNEGFFGATTALNITANQETVALPDDCFEVRALYMIQPNRFQILEYRNNVTESYENNFSTSSQNYIPYYYFQANNLVLRPVPTFTQAAALQLEYIQLPDALIWGGDTLTNQISPIFKELIVHYALYKAKIKESLTMGTASYVPAKEILDGIYLRFKDTVGHRSKYPTYTIPFNP